MRTLGSATIQKVEEICGSGFKPARMFPKFNQDAFDAQKHWMVPDHVEAGSSGRVVLGERGVACERSVPGQQVGKQAHVGCAARVGVVGD